MITTEVEAKYVHAIHIAERGVECCRASLRRELSGDKLEELQQFAEDIKDYVANPLGYNRGRSYLAEIFVAKKDFDMDWFQSFEYALMAEFVKETQSTDSLTNLKHFRTAIIEMCSNHSPEKANHVMQVFRRLRSDASDNLEMYR